MTTNAGTLPQLENISDGGLHGNIHFFTFSPLFLPPSELAPILVGKPASVRFEDSHNSSEVLKIDNEQMSSSSRYNSPTHSSTHSLIHSLTHSLIYSLYHLLIHSLTHSLTHLLIHSLTHSLIHPLTYSSTQ